MSSVDFEFSRQSTYKNKSSADAARETNNKCQIKWIQLIFIKDIFLTSFTKIMGNLFGKEKKSPSRINDQDRAVLVRNSIKKRKKYVKLKNHSQTFILNIFSGIEKTKRSVTQISKKNWIIIRKGPDIGQKTSIRGKERVSYWFVWIISKQLVIERIFFQFFWKYFINFSRAKLLLRKKKFHEGLLAKTDGQLDNLERLVHDLEFAQIEQQV